MTKTIASQSDSHKKYFLTIDDRSAQAVDCSCPDRQYRGHTCKHMAQFGQELAKAETFNSLFQRYDCRANGAEQSHRCYYEMSLGY